MLIVRPYVVLGKAVVSTAAAAISHCGSVAYGFLSQLQPKPCTPVHLGHAQWEVKNSEGNWESLKASENARVEKLYCDPHNEECTAQLKWEQVRIFFEKVNDDQPRFRRHFIKTWCEVCRERATHYMWYWKSRSKLWFTFGQYSSNGSKADINTDDIEKSFLDKRMRLWFQTQTSRYIIRFDTWTQTNEHTRNTRRVRRRPFVADVCVDLFQFLQDLGLGKDVIDHFFEQKIDCYTIVYMDEVLAPLAGKIDLDKRKALRTFAEWRVLHLFRFLEVEQLTYLRDYFGKEKIDCYTIVSMDVALAPLADRVEKEKRVALRKLAEERLEAHNKTEETAKSVSSPATPHFLGEPGGPRILAVNRSNILLEMVEAFTIAEVEEMDLKLEFKGEEGVGEGGISRDAYSTFWSEVYEQYCSGEVERVPTHPHVQQKSWQAVGRILLKGYEDAKIFPTRLSPTFITELVHGEEKVSDPDLIESYKMYLSSNDKEIIEKALKDQLDEEDEEDLMDILSRFGCRSKPSSENMESKIREAAHAELIQKPHYALNAMADTARSGLRKLLPTPQDITDLYKAAKPTARKVITKLNSTPETEKEQQVLDALKRFIKAQDGKQLALFLRFCTGSDSLVGFDCLSVGFSTDALPRANTCGPTLTLPTKYASYDDLRKEFSDILESRYFRFDFE